jgi:hypothetical protein
LPGHTARVRISVPILLDRTVKLRRILYLLLLTSLLGACGRLDTPSPGTYRAQVTLRGGEVPFELQIKNEDGQATLAVVHDNELLPLTSVVMQEGTLDAQLPDAAGTLHATIGRGELKGEVRLIDPQGKPQTLPFAADLDDHYRFVEKTSTDNADISGYWQLEVISPEHFAVPVTLQLQQRFDAVDGRLLLPDGKQVAVFGQVNGDEVYLSTLGQGRAMLLKGKVNQRGELQGDAWSNLSAARSWAARRMMDEQITTLAPIDTQVRKVALPWSVPVRKP